MSESQFARLVANTNDQNSLMIHQDANGVHFGKNEAGLFKSTWNTNRALWGEPQPNRGHALTPILLTFEKP